MCQCLFFAFPIGSSRFQTVTICHGFISSLVSIDWQLKRAMLLSIGYRVYNMPV